MLYESKYIHNALEYVSNAESNIQHLFVNLTPCSGLRWDCGDVRDYLYFISSNISKKSKKSKIEALNDIYNAKRHLWNIVRRDDLDSDLHWKAVEAYGWLRQAEESLHIFIATTEKRKVMEKMNA